MKMEIYEFIISTPMSLHFIYTDATHMHTHTHQMHTRVRSSYIKPYIYTFTLYTDTLVISLDNL